jgi:activator of HSP90 ATPase
MSSPSPTSPIVLLYQCMCLTRTHPQFDIEAYSDSKSKQPVKDLVRASIVPQLRERLVKLGPALITEHGKDIQHAPGSGPSSGTATPAHTSSAPSGASGKLTSAPATILTQVGTKVPLVNVTTVTDTEEFRTTAAELFQTFTDPQRLAAFTRSPPNVFEGAKKGGKFELFGGNVSGEFIELDEPKNIIQSWRLKQWPIGHYSKLDITFDQNDQDAVTVMRVNWDGVPIGQEEVTRRNWGEYYVVSDKLPSLRLACWPKVFPLTACREASRPPLGKLISLRTFSHIFIAALIVVAPPRVCTSSCKSARYRFSLGLELVPSIGYFKL